MHPDVTSDRPGRCPKCGMNLVLPGKESEHHGDHLLTPDLPSRNRLKKFLPLIIIFSLIAVFAIVKQWLTGFSVMGAMSDFMAGFFLVFGGFKIINWKGFAHAYTTYDLIAKRVIAYAYIYPLIELGLGVVYLLRWQLGIVNWITLAVMIVSAVGVAKKLLEGEEVPCACLGLVFKFPMTWVTLAEDLLMAIMAAAMLLLY